MRDYEIDKLFDALTDISIKLKNIEYIMERIKFDENGRILVGE